jgi:hypothetical protein
MRMTAGSHKNVVSKCADSLGIDPELCGLIRIGHSCLDVFSSTSRQKRKVRWGESEGVRDSSTREEEEHSI